MEHDETVIATTPLIDTAEGQRLWAERLAPMFRASVDETVSEEMTDG